MLFQRLTGCVSARLFSFLRLTRASSFLWQVIIYEKPFFEGKCVELETEMCSILTEEGETGETTGDDCLPLASVGSMKVLRGM